MMELRAVLTGFFFLLSAGLLLKVVLLRATVQDLRVVRRSGINGVRELLAQAAIRRVRAWLLVIFTLLIQLIPRVFFDIQAPVVFVFFVYTAIVGISLSETYAEYRYRNKVRAFLKERLE